MSANGLEQIAADLRYAAGDGASRLGAAAAASGRASAQLGLAVHTPGPGLTQLVGHARAHSVYAEADPFVMDEVTDEMATQLADGGVALAMGAR